MPLNGALVGLVAYGDIAEAARLSPASTLYHSLWWEQK